MNSRRILAVGSVALDSVRTPFGQEKDALGGSATFFSASARFFSPVSIVAAVGEDFPKKHLDLLRRMGIDLRDLRVESGQKTFRWKGFYGFDLNNAQTLKTELNVFQTFKPTISGKNRRSRHVFLANIDPDLQLEVLKQMDACVLSACDTMNFWISSKKKSLLRLLQKVDVFLCNDSEARQLSGEHNLLKAARWVRAHGPKLFVIKKGEHGVLCFADGFLFSMPAYPLETVFDPTGAGDSFAGGFIGYLTRSPRMNRQVIRQAVIYGSVLASYNVESFSLARVSMLTRADIAQRYKRFRDLTKF